MGQAMRAIFRQVLGQLLKKSVLSRVQTVEVSEDIPALLFFVN
jgi:hypothetical protein